MHYRSSIIILTIISAILMTACGGTDNAATESIQQASTASSAAEETLAEQTESQKDSQPEERQDTEENGMGRYKDIITELPPDGYDTKREGVTYPEFEKRSYFSQTAERETFYNVLLPADYSEDKQYPVLYLLHGIFGDEYSFSNDQGNKIKEIVGNMAADGIIEETIVVCPDMYAKTDPAQQPGFDAQACLPYDNFIYDLVNDLMPFIESEYPVLTGRENTYLAGFSMGGRETIYITLQRPELFGYVCAISAAPGVVPSKDMYMEHPGQIEESDMRFADGAVEPEVFIICCGTKDSVVGSFPRSYHELFEANGVEHIWYEINGADHDNNAIQSGIYNLFKQITYDKNNE